MIIGRKEEQKILLSAAESEYSELIAVYGRRRVGKGTVANIRGLFL